MSLFKNKRTAGASYVADKSGYQPPPEALDLGKIKPPPKITERKVPTKFSCNMKWEWFRQFTLWERIQILFGCNLVVMTGVATQHRPGEFQPLLMGRVSYNKSATEFMQRVCANMIDERTELPKTAEVQAANLNREAEKKPIPGKRGTVSSHEADPN